MTGRGKLITGALTLTTGVALLVVLSAHKTVAILQPAGIIANQQRSLMIFASLLSLIVIIPVFSITIFVVWRYREGNHKAAYRPNWDHSRVAETIWWLIPTALIGVLAVTAWRSTHSLDPTRPIASQAKPIEVQAVALQWKWLFMYPQYGVASVNQLQVPVGRPVHFAITADAPMNSLWIPQLGGQIYAMPGMSTELNLRADKVGTYSGWSANISGDGFADMHFKVYARPADEFASSIKRYQQAGDTLNSASYKTLSRPGPSQVRSYGKVSTNLFAGIVDKYMPDGHMNGAVMK